MRQKQNYISVKGLSYAGFFMHKCCENKCKVFYLKYTLERITLYIYTTKANKMKTKIFFLYQVATTVNFEFEGEYLQLPSDCFITDFSTMEDDQYVNAEFVEGFTEEMLWDVLDAKRNELSKNQKASLGSWKEIKAAWLSEKNA